MSYNYLHSYAVREILVDLRDTKIRALGLGGNGAVDDPDELERITSNNLEIVNVLIEELLSNENKLQELALGNNLLGDEGVRILAIKVLGTESSILQKLDLSENEIGNEGIAVLADALKINKSLSVLSLGGNAMDVTGVELLAGALERNSNLQKLVLSNTGMNIAKIKLLIEALKRNKSLQALDLEGNILCMVGVRMFIETWINNMDSMHLQEIDLRDNIPATEIQPLSTNDVIDKLILLSQKEVLTKDLVQKTVAQS